MATGTKVLIGAAVVAAATGIGVLAWRAVGSADRDAGPGPRAEVGAVRAPVGETAPVPALAGRAAAADPAQRSPRDVDAEIAALLADAKEVEQQAAWLPVEAEEVRKVLALRGSVPPRTVEVLVLDGVEPLPGARVGLSGGRIDAQGATPRSVDADGRFRAADLVVDAARTWDLFNVRVETPGEERRTASIVVHEGRPAERIVLRYGRATIEGIVRDEAGRPLPGAWVPVEYMGPFEACNTFGVTVRTDASGRFSVGRLPDGRYRVAADPTDADGEPAGWERTTVMIAGDDVMSLELGASPSTPLLRGSVVSASGAPVAGPGMVLLVRDDGTEVEARLDASGGFRRRVAAGVYRVRVLPAGYPYPSWIDVPRTVEVAAESPAVEVRLPGVRVEGRVLDDATGQPIADAEVHVSWVAKDAQEVNPYRAVPAPGGAFACDGLVAGRTYVFRVRPFPLARDEDGFEVTLARDETLRRIDLRAVR